MVKIFGTIKCEDCGLEEDDADMYFECPHCKSKKIKHTPPHKIYLCERDNPEGFGKSGGKLGNIHHKIKDNIDMKGETYKNIKQLVLSKQKDWTSKEIINYFRVEGFTDGDVILRILDLLVCQGYLEKKFMKKNKYHEYLPSRFQTPCPYLDEIRKGKRAGIKKCKFDFKNEGRKIDSRKVFNKK